jgi:flagellar hook-length control protein FliK
MPPAPAKTAVSANTAANAAASSSSSTAAAPADGATPQSNANASPAANLAMTARSGAAAGPAGSSGPANAQAANNAVQSATANLPAFGIVAANAATAQTTAAAFGSTRAAVSISGLPVAIAARAVAGSNQFDIRLDPPELGRIDVQLNVDGNGQVTSHVTVDRPETLTLLQSQQPQLERALEQAGLKTADNGLQFSLRDQSFAGANTGGNSGGGTQQSQSPSQQLVIPDADLPSIDATQAYSRWGLGGGIDITV